MIDLIRNKQFAEAGFWFVSVFIALSFHEFAHAYAAYKCGDYTARNLGRLTLNPLPHIDPIGMLMLVFVGVGWASPVPVVMRNFNKPKRDLALVSLAGPLMNFSLGFIGSFGYVLSVFVMTRLDSGANFAYYLAIFFLYFSMINIGLGVFNLIPVPPLDGSKILAGLLPSKLSFKFLRYQRYAILFFAVLLICSYFPGMDVVFTPLMWLRDTLLDGFISFFTWIIV